MTISDFIDDQVQGQRRTARLGPVKLPWPFPIADGLNSSAAMVLGWPVYGADAPGYVRLAHRAFRSLSNAKYWLYYRLHPAHRYHIIDTGLGYGYHERDSQLLYGAMACLIGYVDDCERSGCHDPGDEARAILHWWRETRPHNQAQYDKWMTELYSGKSRMNFVPVEGQPKLTEIVFDLDSEEDAEKRKAMWALAEQMHKDEQDYLQRLVAIRPGMWT